DAGFDMRIDGDGFTSIQYQNANNSVRVTDDFMGAVEDGEEWRLTARTNGEPVGDPIDARELMRQIAQAAWQCADPGVQYDTTINDWHTCPNSGRINASNPCSEYMHVDDSACNLASLNLMKFRRPDGTFDVDAFEHTVDIVFLAQEIIVGPSSYPTEEIGVNARAFRQLGLGSRDVGPGGQRRRGARLPQRAGDRAGPDGDDLVPHGLRHDGRRARLLPGQVQGARRRRQHDDRQPHRAAGAADARLLRRGHR